MKKLLFTLMLVLVAGLAARADVTINSSNFPDDNFRSYLLSLYPAGYITTSQINSRTLLDVRSKNISDLAGIKYFTALKSLNCNSNWLNTLDLSGMSSLDTLRCAGNVLTTLDVTGCTAMTWLQCFMNPDLASIEGLATCTAIKFFACYSCSLTNLNIVNSMKNLEQLHAYDNRMTSFRLTNMSQLETVSVGENPEMNKVTVTDCPHLRFLHCDNNPAQKALLCYNNDSLITVYMMETPAMENVYCYNCPELYNLQGIENCHELSYLDCSDCKFSYSLDLPRPNKLTQLFCYNNKLTKLDLRGFTYLENLYCENNNLNSLDLRGCSSLSNLVCCNNQLTKLNFLICNSLEFIRCDQNQIKDEGMTTLVGSLPMRSADSPGTLRVIYDNGEGNIMTAAQIAAAKAKNWTPEHYIGNLDWEEYTVIQPGDVNGDGNVNIADINAVIDLILSGTYSSSGDVNGDGSINISDINALIAIILKKG